MFNINSGSSPHYMSVFGHSMSSSNLFEDWSFSSFVFKHRHTKICMCILLLLSICCKSDITFIKEPRKTTIKVTNMSKLKQENLKSTGKLLLDQPQSVWWLQNHHNMIAAAIVGSWLDYLTLFLLAHLFQTWLAYSLFKIHLPVSLLKNLVFATSRPFSLSCIGFLFTTE